MSENIYGPGNDDYGRNPSPFKKNDMEVKSKLIYVKPSFYARCYEPIKKIALKYGYNLLLNGSMNRDFDLVAVPWSKELGNVDTMIQEIADFVGGCNQPLTDAQRNCFPHGRISYIIDINRGGKFNNYEDKQYYFDISVISSAPDIKTEQGGEYCVCEDGGKYLDGAYDTHCDRCKKHLR